MTASNDENRRTAYLAAQLENLSFRAAKSGIVLYSDFLSLPEQKKAEAAAAHAGCSLYLYGGCLDSQRRTAGFGGPGTEFDEADFPIVILHLQYEDRFLRQELTHRDFLGALMGLSVRREMIGDIIIGEGEAWICVHEKTADYLLAELKSVGKASVTAEAVPFCPLSAAPEFTEERITVASMRLDSVTAQLMKTSRGQAAAVLELKNVRVDQQVETKPDFLVKDGQEISIRGFGKYRIGSSVPTRRGRIAVSVLKYQ